MIQYFYLFLIVTILNIIRILIIDLNSSTLRTGMRLYNSFWAIISASTLLYLIVFVLMALIHFSLNKLFEISRFYCYMYSIIAGFVVFLMFFTVYLGNNLKAQFFQNHIFMIYYIVVFVFLSVKYYKLQM